MIKVKLEVCGNTQTTAYTLVLTDHGKHINTNVEVTINSVYFLCGSFNYNHKHIKQLINFIQGSGLTLRNAGQTTTGDRVINNYGLVTVFLHLLFFTLAWFGNCIMTHYNLLALGGGFAF